MPHSPDFAEEARCLAWPVCAAAACGVDLLATGTLPWTCLTFALGAELFLWRSRRLSWLALPSWACLLLAPWLCWSAGPRELWPQLCLALLPAALAWRLAALTRWTALCARAELVRQEARMTVWSLGALATAATAIAAFLAFSEISAKAVLATRWGLHPLELLSAFLLIAGLSPALLLRRATSSEHIVLPEAAQEPPCPPS